MCALCLVVAGSARSDCQEPADEFSAQIGPLLMVVEGPGFPSAGNLAGWPERIDEIQTTFGEILTLTVGDDERRGAAIAALIAAEAIARSDWDIGMETGEARAWTRRVLKDYTYLGATPADRKFVNQAILAELVASLDNQDVAHPQRSLPLYREKAAALRDLATSKASASCEKGS